MTTMAEASNRTGPGLPMRPGPFKNVLHFLRPFALYHLLGKPTPVLAGYKITHKCNLTCRHCPYWKRKVVEQGYQGVIKTLETLRGMGVRILILEGGEPLLWRHGRLDIHGVIEAARRMFPSVCMTTNGTMPWGHLALDRVWVSLDGREEINDSLRGKGVFRKVMGNIESHGIGKVFVSTTVSTGNILDVPDLIAELSGKVAGVTIQFYYPYEGLPDPLFVDPKARIAFLDRLIEMKKCGHVVANTFASLEQLKTEGWYCEDRFLANAEPDGTISHGCYLKNRGPTECRLCGFSAHNEMTLAFRGRFASIRAGLNTFFG